jgi:hypothetical protein
MFAGICLLVAFVYGLFFADRYGSKLPQSVKDWTWTAMVTLVVAAAIVAVYGIGDLTLSALGWSAR